MIKNIAKFPELSLFLVKLQFGGTFVSSNFEHVSIGLVQTSSLSLYLDLDLSLYLYISLSLSLSLSVSLYIYLSLSLSISLYHSLSLSISLSLYLSLFLWRTAFFPNFIKSLIQTIQSQSFLFSLHDKLRRYHINTS